jgi:hypothetical protein
MADELPDVPALRTHEPPAGGLAALRERIDRPRSRWWWLVAVPALALAVLVLVLVQRPRGPAVVEERPPETALRDREVGGDVAFYWVASRPSSGRTARPRATVSEVTTISLDDAPRVTTYGAP